MKPFSHLEIKQEYVSLFASGNSVLRLTQSELALLYEKTFMVTTNYAPIRFKSHLNAWSDKQTTQFLDQYYQTHPKECLFLIRKEGLTSDTTIGDQVDYYFSKQQDKLYGNFTAGWVLQLLTKNFPDKKILLFGWDFEYVEHDQSKWYDQYTSYDKTKRGSGFVYRNQLEQFKRQLTRMDLPTERIFNCNPRSGIDFFQRGHWSEVLPLNILHLCNSPLAGAPVHLSKIINQYTPHHSKTILKQDFSRSSKLNKMHWDYDEVSPSGNALQKGLAWADMVHQHGRVYPGFGGQIPCVLQYHSEPGTYKAGRTDEAYRDRKLVVAQYHPRFYTDAYIVPNLIDIWATPHLPVSRTRDVVHIFYSWASERTGWAAKGSRETKAILNQIKEKYGDKLVIEVYNNEPYDKCLVAKQQAHICIDECVTGSYHLQSLEGCSVGAVTFNNMDEQTLGFLKEVSGADSHPFEVCPIDGLFDQLCHYIENPTARRNKGSEARKWMEQYWDPRTLVKRFLKAYCNVLAYGQVNPNQDRVSAILEEEQSGKTDLKNALDNSIAYHSPRQKRTDRAVQRAAQKMVPRTSNRVVNRSIPPRRVRRSPVPQAPIASPSPTVVQPPQSMINPADYKGKSIQELHQCYHGETIHVFGTGPSLRKIDPAQYEHEICLGVNYAFELMPHMNYNLAHVIEVYENLKNAVEANTLILPASLVRRWYREPAKRIKPDRIIPNTPEAYVYPIQDPFERELRNKDLSLGKDALIFTWSTTMHSAIHLAAYMGAKEIRLIGVDYSPFENGKLHFNSQYDKEYGQQNWNAHRKHQQGEFWLKEQLKLQGIDLINLSHSLLHPHKAPVFS